MRKDGMEKFVGAGEVEGGGDEVATVVAGAVVTTGAVVVTFPQPFDGPPITVTLYSHTTCPGALKPGMIFI